MAISYRTWKLFQFNENYSKINRIVYCQNRVCRRFISRETPLENIYTFPIYSCLQWDNAYQKNNLKHAANIVDNSNIFWSKTYMTCDKYYLLLQKAIKEMQSDRFPSGDAQTTETTQLSRCMGPKLVAGSLFIRRRHFRPHQRRLLSSFCLQRVVTVASCDVTRTMWEFMSVKHQRISGNSLYNG